LTLEELGLTEGPSVEKREDLLVYSIAYGGQLLANEKGAFSFLLGKRLIQPLPKGQSGFGGFADKEPRKYVDFIIGGTSEKPLLTPMIT
jgi:hypothetical protein